MDKYKASDVINGTWGEMWLNGDLMAETIALQAKVTLTKTASKHVRNACSRTEGHWDGPQRDHENKQGDVLHD